jgi:hypothetical protein
VSAHRTRASVSSSSSLSLVDKAKPQTGAGKMAAAAAAGLKRSDDDAPPEEHPLSDRRLTAR